MIVWLLVAIEAVALALAVIVAAGCEIRRWLLNPRSVVKSLADSALAPLIAVIAYALVDEVTIELVRLHLTGTARPFHGADRALYHATNGLVLGWPCCLAAASWRVFAWPAGARRVVPCVAACWAGVVVAMVTSYPIGRDGTALVLQVVEVAGVACAVVPIAGAWRRPWGRAHVGVGLLVAVEVAVALLGPWLRDVYRGWRLATCGYVVGFGALAGLLVWWEPTGPGSRGGGCG